MVQATVCTKDDDDLAGALYAVVLRLSHLPVNERVDKAGLAVLHETRRLGTFRPSDLAAQMRLDLSTADPDDARAQRITITAHGGDVLNRVLEHRAATIRDAIVHWPEGDRSTLRQLLCRLADDLRDISAPYAPAVVDEVARSEVPPVDNSRQSDRRTSSNS
jgi:hypothetical protein